MGPDFATRAEQEHRDSYWKQVAKHKFCWIDTDTTLSMGSSGGNTTDDEINWKEFFLQRFSSTKN